MNARDDTATQSEKIFEVRNLCQNYGKVQALRNVSCHAARGEFVTLLGSSGSGKSTLLRILAGLELPSQVDLLTLEGEDVSHVPANRRNVSTVFQHYGLFPHLNVIENVEYGLRVRKVPKEERRKKALGLLEQVKLLDFANRPIAQLSGGQKQRVALARSLVLEPAILLLDEPLGALDEKLRLDMQIELVELQKHLGMTFVYVTHSQEEALTMSDRILLMDQGQIIQEGSPEDIFDRPNSRFAAEFMGMENILEAEVTAQNGGYTTAVINGVEIAGIWTGEGTPTPGQQIVCAFRSEKIRSASHAPTGDLRLNRIDAVPVSEIYKGKYLDVTVETKIGDIRLRVWDDHFELGEHSQIVWRADQTIFLPRSNQ